MTRVVRTIAGPFSRDRLARLKRTLEQAKAAGMTRDQVTQFEGQELLIAFGEYLAEFVEGEFDKNGH